MSNPLTNYTVYNPNTSYFQDISGIFQPYSGGIKAPLTYYNVNGIDLCNIFDPISVGTSINFNTNITVNGNDLRNIFAAYQQTVSYTATGNYTVYTNGIYTGIVFEYDTLYNGAASINFSNAPPNASLIMVGGGGGGWSGTDNIGTNSGQPSGGGGGGVIYYQNLQLSSSTTYNITIGQGGIGATPISSASNGNTSLFGSYNAYGGSKSGSGSIAYGGGINIANGGGGGVGCYPYNLVNNTYSNNGGTNINNSNIGQFVYSNNFYNANGGSSYFSNSGIPINIPFYGVSSELLCGGGGGSGGNSTGGNGGLAGNGFGGQAKGSTSINGSSGYNIISQGYGGGGGGGGNDAQFPPTYGNGGNGGNGVVILYWPPYNILNSQLTIQSSTVLYTPYYNNGYTGYILYSGSGNIIFNSNITNATLILIGGGGSSNTSGLTSNEGSAGGGGGGITIISNSLNVLSGKTLNFSIGIGGTPSGNSSTESYFGTNDNSYNYISYGGSNSSLLNGGNGGSINTIYGGGGGGGGCGYNTGTLTYGNGGSGGSNSILINNGSNGNSSSPQNGGNSFYGSTSFLLPFLDISSSILAGGGGGGAKTNGGLAGNGIGGDGNSNLTTPAYMGENGKNSIILNGTGCFGSGGGGTYLATGGYGGNGVLILYWQ
mgnify:CR=1 FL=1